MRIYGPNGTTLGMPASNARRTSPGSFALPETTTAQETRAATAPKTAANIDALLALQGIEEDPTERRRRSVARGKGALDVLDDLKIGLLSGNLNASTVSRLRDAAANLKSSSGVPGLDAVPSTECPHGVARTECLPGVARTECPPRSGLHGVALHGVAPTECPPRSGLHGVPPRQ